MAPPYAELHAYSCFSFRRGASSVEDLVARAAELDLSGLAVTDRDGLYGAVRLWKAAEEHPALRALYGAELGLDDGSRLVALARDREGWANLSALITESRTACEKGGALLSLDQIVQRSRGLTVLSGGRVGSVDRTLLGLDGGAAVRSWRPRGPWGRPLGVWTLDPDSPLPAGPTEAERALLRARELWPRRRAERVDPEARYRRALDTAARLRDAFGDAFLLELQDHHTPEDHWLRALITRISAELGLPRVVTGGVYYARPQDRALQDVLTCVRLHTTLDEAGTALLPNGHFALRSPRQMERLFADDPAALAMSVEVARGCTFSPAELPYSFPVHPVPPGHTLQSRLEEMSWEGASRRYGRRLESEPRVQAQIQHELDVIGRLGLAGYFLVVQDISAECARRGILSQGRGSAANSAVCYCLGITAVDPVGLDLLFERFLSEARGGWPDIDIDISNSMREEVLQFVYEKYGRDRVAMVSNVITWHPRSAIRDVGKVFGLGVEQVDRMARALGGRSSPDELREAFGLDTLERVGADVPLLDRVVEFTSRLCGLPRHLGIHSGGVVISGQPIGEACPVENASLEDRTVLQWDKDDVAHAGMVKIDLLALGMLSVIQESTRLLGEQGRRFEMADLTYDDPAVYDLITEADTVGLFQIESRAQINTLPRLRPRCFHDLVVEVALIRPGPIQGDMVHPYLRRRQGKEPVTYAHPSLRPMLQRTLGIPLFQEQAMKMAITAAGFTPGEADRLRKVMGFKRGQPELERLLGKMVDGMLANGFAVDVAHRIRQQLRGFAAYGFPESHAASFALIVYASAHLKRHHPEVFYAALLNSQPLGFYSPATLVGDARRHGVEVLPLCANRSSWRWSVLPPSSRGARLRAGLMQVRGLGEEDGAIIEDVRRLGGPYSSVLDFCERTALPRDTLEKLAQAGVFDSMGLGRRQALWEVAGYRKRLPLEAAPRQVVLPGFPALSAAEVNVLDHATAGFSAREHPFCFLRRLLARRGYLDAHELPRRGDGAEVRAAGVVITRQRPQTAKGTFFMTLEDELGLINVIVRAADFDRRPRMLRTVKLLSVSGRLQVQEGVVQLLARRFDDLGRDDEVVGILGGRKGWTGLESRDFH